MLKFLMVKYRSSRFHNAKNGRRLAKLMAVAVAFTRNPTRTKTIDGITYELDLREVIDSSLYFTSTYEVKIDRLFEKYVKPGSTVIDIGANIGLHTLRSALLTGQTGKIIAIEPSTWAIKKLQRNLELNPQLSKIIEIRHNALGENVEKAISLGFQSSYRLNGKNEIYSEVVDVLTLDSIAEHDSLQSVDFIKIDVDGHELHILRGAKQLLSISKPVLVVEFTPSYSISYLDELTAIEQYLQSLGYSVFTDDELSVPSLTQYLKLLPVGHSAMILIIAN
jgi:FkbM family methyltransferase